jgi:hypothetical protein
LGKALVPQEQLKIARSFNCGYSGQKRKVPARRLNVQPNLDLPAYGHGLFNNKETKKQRTEMPAEKGLTRITRIFTDQLRIKTAVQHRDRVPKNPKGI